VARPDRGTREWFKRENVALTEHLKAVNSFSAAVRSFEKLIDLGATGDTEVREALHTSGVINYARPFSAKPPFAKKIIRHHAKYDEAIHKQLVELRNKLIAHSDRDYADARIFKKFLSLRQGSKHIKALVGAALLTQTVHLLDDIQLADRYLTHVRAAEGAAAANLQTRFEEFAKAAQQFPGALNAATPKPTSPLQISEPVELNQPRPLALLNPHAILSKPPLKIGQDGYGYRGLSMHIDLSTEVTWTADDGSDVAVSWGAIKAPPSR